MRSYYTYLDCKQFLKCHWRNMVPAFVQGTTLRDIFFIALRFEQNTLDTNSLQFAILAEQMNFSANLG